MPPSLVRVPELLAPAGSLDAVRAAVANGADAVYLGAAKFNARDEGAQLSLDELRDACAIAHERNVRVYLTLNVLVKPAELHDALLFLGECIDRGIDAAIVQDVGLVRLIQTVYPGFELHGSTQMTVHDASGAAVMLDLGVDRVVLARENTIEDVRAIRAAVPALGLETFVHGALCIAYSGQCFMSGMISERSANRGSCAQSCRKDYVLRDATTGATLDTGYLISARDLAAHDHLGDLAAAGVGCLKIEGRKKKPEYVATVTSGYRAFLDRIARGEQVVATPAEVEPLVQIFSRGFTGGMYGGREGRSYVTRTHPDNRGIVLGRVLESARGELLIELTSPVAIGDGLGFEPPPGTPGERTGFTVESARTVSTERGTVHQVIAARERVPVGWQVIRTSHAELLQRARASYAAFSSGAPSRRIPVNARVFGAAGAPLKLIVTADDESVTLRGEHALVPAVARALDHKQLREQLGRLGETPFALGTLDDSALGAGLFVPVSELNHLRQRAVEELMTRRDWAASARLADRTERVRSAVAGVTAASAAPASPALSASVYTLDDARAAARGGATEVVLDPFLRHPPVPLARVRACADELASAGIAFRWRTPTIVRPAERRALDKWLALDLPVLSGHLGLVAELARGGRDVVADYAVNCFNQHTAAELFRLGARRVTLSVELTADEMLAVTEPWRGAGFRAFVFGRPEGMTIEHCVLSAAFDREPATCRDLCVQKHVNVELTDPTGYTFPVATDSACRNRLLHSRPVEGSEFLPRLWAGGVREFQLVFNVAGDPVEDIVRRYRAAVGALADGRRPDLRLVRDPFGGEFTRGHFARAV